MPQSLIVCCDGTWNDPDDQTHIHWISQHCQRDDADPLRQRVKEPNPVPCNRAASPWAAPPMAAAPLPGWSK